jgi:hypothetical protein
MSMTRGFAALAVSGRAAPGDITTLISLSSPGVDGGV